MRTQSPDTHPDIERKQIEIMRGFSPSRKFELVAGWLGFLTKANRINQRGPEQHITNVYGMAWSKRYRRYLLTHPNLAQQTSQSDLTAALLAATEPLHRRGIPYALTGRLACSIYGLHSAVTSIELLVQYPRHLILSPIHTRHDDSYLDVQHLMLVQLSRTPALITDSVPFVLIPDHSPIMLLTPEAVTVELLHRFIATGAQDDALYNDLLGLVKVQAPHMDIPYLFAKSLHRNWMNILLDDAGVNR